jgi:hypothetical protein
MKRNCFMRLIVATAILASYVPANAEISPQKPHTMGEIAQASQELAQRNETCRQQAREQHLHFIKRKLFMHSCLHPN